MRKLTSEEVIGLFQSSSSLHKKYKKKGIFLFRPALSGESVLTIVSGKLETIKTAQPGEVVLRNIELGSSAEMYIIGGESFEKRYTPLEKKHYVDQIEWRMAEAKGEAVAFPYDGDIIAFQAPWGEEMVCYPGDYIASPVGGKETDVYRIERETFEQTYFEIA